MILAILQGCTTPPSEPTEHSFLIETDEPNPTEVSIVVETTALFACEQPDLHEERPIGRQSLGEDWEQQIEGLSGEYSGWGLAVHDFNADGHWDVFLPHFGAPDQLYFGQSDGGVVDASHLLQDGDLLAFGATAADIDHDGDVDILVGAERGNYMYRNDGTSFELLKEESFLTESPTQGRTHHLAIADIDQDGWFDLFGPTFYARFDSSDSPDQERCPNNLLHFGEDFWRWSTFDNWPDLGLQNSPANAGGFLDIDDDGDLDVFIVNDKPQHGYLSGVLENKGDRHFVKIDDRGTDVATQGMGLAWGDVNLDGHLDFAITGWSEIKLLLNDGSDHWYEAALASGLVADIQRVVGWGIEMTDLDNDGDEDVLVAYGSDYDTLGQLGQGAGFPNDPEQYLALYRNDQGQFTLLDNTEWDFGLPSVFRGYALVDWNVDGYLDVIARDLHGNARYYQSQCGANRSLQISLAQNGPNATAIGARIWVTDSQGLRRFRDIVAGSTNISSSAPPVAHFGLANERTVDIEIRWPDQSLSHVSNVSTGQWISIVRDD